MKHSVAQFLVLPAFVFVSALAQGQPLPEEIPMYEQPSEYELYPAADATIWRVPGASELDWVVAYDETPLTFDDPRFELRLINAGRPVRVPGLGNGQRASAVLVLTKPTGEVVKLEAESDGLIVYQSNRDNGKIDTNTPVLRLGVSVFDKFGQLGPGEHTLVVHIATQARLERARDGHTIDDALTAVSPRLRFTVVEREIPELTSDEGYLLTEDEHGVLLTNPFDEAITVHVDGGYDEEPTTDKTYFMYNTYERLSDDGWVPSGPRGFCGTGMRRLTLEPGESVRVTIHGSYERGIIRSVVNAQRADGEVVRFYTKPKFNEGQNPW